MGGARLTTPAWTDHREGGVGAAKEKVTTVKRYWKGQAPAWQEDEQRDEHEHAVEQGRRVPAPPVVVKAGPREVKPPEVVARAAPAGLPRAAPVEEEELDDEELDRRRAEARARCVWRAQSE